MCKLYGAGAAEFKSRAARLRLFPKMNEASDPSDPPLRDFRAPRYWPTWALLGLMRLSARLPVGGQLGLGSAIGWILRMFKQLEMGIGWFTPIETLRRRVEIRGLEHLEAALEGGKGALLLTAHFTPIEIGVGVLEDFPGTVNSLYRPQRNALMDYLILRGRRRFASAQVPRDNVRALIRLLKRNEAVLYMPDQTYLGNQSALIPFFGEPAMTNIATSKIAKISGAPVLPYWFRRKPDERSYEVEICAPLEDFPTEDAIADTRRLVGLLEERIRKTPEQYLWIYKKFKRRPASFGDVYAD
jgi:KDO2-lipid IV(A) lauroyltransferase